MVDSCLISRSAIFISKWPF